MTKKQIIIGIDTHKEFHVAAAIDLTSRVVDYLTFDANRAGFRDLIAWVKKTGSVLRFGIEGTGCYGASLSRFLAANNFEVLEINRPNRQLRRSRGGKTDYVDAESAARSALSGELSICPKSALGYVESLRPLRVTRRSAIKSRSVVYNQIEALLVTAQDQLREESKKMTRNERITFLSQKRPDESQSEIFALRSLAKRALLLTEEINEIDQRLERILAANAPKELLELKGVGTDVAGALLVAIGDNPDRMRSVASFSALCGVSPVNASSGKTIRHRVNRGGNREANSALWRIVMVRLSHDERTKTYVEKRTLEGKSKKEIIRCLKSYVAREVFNAITTSMSCELAQAA